LLINPNHDKSSKLSSAEKAKICFPFVLNLWRDLINGSITVSKTKNMFSSLKSVKIQRHVFIFNNKIVFWAALKTRHFFHGNEDFDVL
jgi:hypothetical protein